jgi:twinkle protein
VDVITRRESVEERAARFRAEQLDQIRKGAQENPLRVMPRPVGRMLVTQANDLKEPEEILLDISAQNPAELLREYRAKQAKYVTTPFDPEGRKLRFYPGGYSVWSGFPGAGKSTLLRQSICHWLNSGEGVFVASLEEHPRDLLIRLAGTAFGRDEPTEQQLQWFCDYYGDRLRIWGMIGVSSHRKILSTIQLLSEKGVTQAVIDSLMKLDVDGDKLEPQRQFSNLLAAVCQTTKVHTHLVAHPRKAQTAEQDVHLNDVGGAKEIGAGADNILFTRRGGEQDSFGEVCGMKISIRKQRHGSGAIGDITGWFNRRLRQFKFDQFDQVPTQYLPKQAYEDCA